MKRCIVLTMVIFVLAVFSVDLNAAMGGNELDKAYCGGVSGNPCPPYLPKTKSSDTFPNGSTIRELIIQGGGSLYRSGSHINAFFNAVELSELSSPDYKQLQGTLNEAIFTMENARATYLQLKHLAGVTPYNPEVITRLVNFDYNTFQKENGLIAPIFKNVRELLAVGDVTGIFNEFEVYCGQILDILYTLKKDIDAGIFPNLSTVWRVNQKYSEFKLFGQYATQVFYGIK